MKDLKLTLSSIGDVIKTLTDIIMGDQGKTYRVSIKEWREKRSLSQNSLYWVWLDEISKQCNLESDASTKKSSELWHEVFKHYYCPAKTIKNNNASLTVKSTTMLDVGEMTFYLNKIESWCLDRGVRLTIPEDSEYYKLLNGQNE